MRIGFVIPYWTTWGGSARVVQEVTKRLAATGHEIIVFTTDVGADDRRLVPPTEVDGVLVRSFRNVSRKLARRSRAFMPPAFFAAFGREVASLDVVHVVDYRHVLGSWALRRARKAGVPTIFSPHGSLPNAEGRPRLKGGYDRVLGRRDLRLASHFHVLTAAEAGTLESLGVSPDRMTVIPNGVTIPRPIKDDERARARAAFGVSESEIAVLFMGRLVPRKGLLLLLDAVSRLVTGGAPLKVLVAGADDGDLPNAQRFVSERGIGDRVNFLGFVEGQEKREVFSASDVFALWSSYEGQPMAVLEAMSYGLCAVVSAEAAVNGMENGRAGVVLVERTAEEGARVLAGTLDDPGVRDRLGSAGRAMVEAEYSWTRVVSEYEKAYARVVVDRDSDGESPR